MTSLRPETIGTDDDHLHTQHLPTLEHSTDIWLGQAPEIIIRFDSSQFWPVWS